MARSPLTPALSPLRGEGARRTCVGVQSSVSAKRAAAGWSILSHVENARSRPKPPNQSECFQRVSLSPQSRLGREGEG